MAEQKASAGRRKGFLLAFLLFGPAFLLIFISSRGCEHKFKELDDLGPIPRYTFTDINGKKYTNKSFKGQIVLYTTLQVKCPDSCAISFWHLDQMIYQHIRKNKKKLGHVKIVSFITDEQGKPVTNLKDLSYTLKDQVEEYNPKIWILANGDAKTVYNITRNKENLLAKGSKYFAGEAFLELLLLGDKQNHLRMVLKGNSEGMMRRMKEHIALLEKQYDKADHKKKH